jgi:hypothetical protein
MRCDIFNCLEKMAAKTLCCIRAFSGIFEMDVLKHEQLEVTTVTTMSLEITWSSTRVVSYICLVVPLMVHKASQTMQPLKPLGCMHAPSNRVTLVGLYQASRMTTTWPSQSLECGKGRFRE